MTSSEFNCDVLIFQIKVKDIGDRGGRMKKETQRIDSCNTKFLLNYRKNVRG